MADNPLDGRAARLKALFIATMQSIEPASEEQVKEIEPKLDLAAKALVEAFDILNS